MSKIEKLLEIEEGFRAEPYYCSEGYPTIGIGTKIGRKGEPLENYTIRVSRETARCMMHDELKSATEQLKKYDWFNSLNEDRQAIIQSMAYQMGVSGVLKFNDMIAGLEAGDFDAAEYEALDSLWAKIQTPPRAARHAHVLRTGNLNSVNEYAGLGHV